MSNFHISEHYSSKEVILFCLKRFVDWNSGFERVQILSVRPSDVADPKMRLETSFGFGLGSLFFRKMMEIRNSDRKVFFQFLQTYGCQVFAVDLFRVQEEFPQIEALKYLKNVFPFNF